MPIVFYHILGNNLVANVVNFTVWFAVTFWVFLETKSVFATGMIAGIYLVFTAAFGFWFGSLVDHYPKRQVMLASSVASAILYAIGFAILLVVPEPSFRDVGSVWLWAFILIVMLGVIAGNIRSIALPTLVTVLVPEAIRDKANDLVGMVSGIGFLTTSVISGFLVAWGGMHVTLIFALALTVVVFAHLLTVKLDEKPGTAPAAAEDKPAAPKRVDIKGTIAVIVAVPGLFALIFFATFNNFLGGVFMALVDAYALSLVSVEIWGLLLGFLSTAFIVSGVVISRVGLGKSPLRTLMIVNCITWTVCIFFTIQSSIWLLAIGFFIWMFAGPWAEAAEHTTLQKVVPVERQGRVFGFAQSVEQAASPLTAFLIGPIAQFFFIPLMSEGGAGAAVIGGWFGVGPERGIALVFVLAGIIGLAVTIIAFNSRYYRQLSASYAKAPDPEDGKAA